MEIILQNKTFINKYLKYVKEIYKEAKMRSSRVLIKKILGIIKKSKI